MIKNKKANKMRRLCSEYKRDNNLGLAYKNFNLMEKMEKMHKCCPEWAEYEFKKHNNDKLTTIFLPEFMNWYLFVSSYAWLINSFFWNQRSEVASWNSTVVCGFADTITDPISFGC